VATSIIHNGGLPTLVSEIGFEVVKYFEGTISGTLTMTLDPPARRLVLRNTDTANSVFLDVNGGVASTATSLVPGDNIRIPAQAIFTMDFDALRQISMATGAVSVFVEGTLGYKGVK